MTVNPKGEILLKGPAWVRASAIPETIRKFKPEIVQYLKAEQWDLVCDRCGTGSYVMVEIHDGRSTRLDCAICSRFLRFGTWYNKENELEN